MRSGNHKCLLSPRVAPNPLSVFEEDGIVTDLLTQIEIDSCKDIWDENSKWLREASLKSINNMRREGLLVRKGIAFLDLEFCDFSAPVIFFENETYSMLNREVPPTTLNSFKQQSNINGAEQMIKCFETKGVQFFIDPEVARDKENPSAVKHFKMTMNLDDNLLLYPEARDKKMLEAIVKKSPLQEISVDEKTLLWRYRKFLQSEKRIGTKALTKFLRSVDWSIDREAKEAASLMQGWTKIDIPDALFLLSKYFKGVDSVRNHAVNVLKNAPEQDILSVLLQLVQALRYEHDMRTCKLADLLIEKAERSLMVSNDLYWYLTIACEDSIMGEFYYSYRARVLENYKTVSLNTLNDIILKI